MFLVLLAKGDVMRYLILQLVRLYYTGVAVQEVVIFDEFLPSNLNLESSSNKISGANNGISYYQGKRAWNRNWTWMMAALP